MTSCHYSSSFASHDLFCLITWPLILSPPLPFFVSVYSYSLFFSCLSPLHMLSLIFTFAFLTFDLFIHYDTCLYLPNFETRFIDRLFVLIYYQSVFQVPFLVVKSEFRAIFSLFFFKFLDFQEEKQEEKSSMSQVSNRPDLMNLSFSGCGFLCVYHTGVAAAIKVFFLSAAILWLFEEKYMSLKD